MQLARNLACTRIENVKSVLRLEEVVKESQGTDTNDATIVGARLLFYSARRFSHELFFTASTAVLHF